MASISSMFLNIRGAKHPIRPGITVIGSANNERYNTILLQDESICQKHASVRYDQSTNKLHVLDLCSLHGVTVDQKPIDPLAWIEFTPLNNVLFGRVSVSIENKSKAEVSSFLENDESSDFIDCSLEEAQLFQGSKQSHTSNGAQQTATLLETSAIVHNPPSSVTNDRNSFADSFVVPATQQLDESRLSAVTEKRTVPVPEPDQNEEENEDDFLFIPETQQPPDDDCLSQSIDPILSDGYKEASKRVTNESEYFQMTEDHDDDSNDAIFNNEYVLESQNLMQHLDEAYKAPGEEPRKYIVPERSVDSISFQEHRNTTKDMSRIEWDESNQENEQTMTKEQLQKPKVGNDLENRSTVEDNDDRSLTPDLNFDNNLADARETSVTPDINFADGLSNAPNGIADEECGNRMEALPQLDIDTQGNNGDNEHELSLNQEGFFKESTTMVHGDKSKKDGTTVDDIYDMQTQALNIVDPYDMQTQPLPLPENEADLETQGRTSFEIPKQTGSVRKEVPLSTLSNGVIDSADLETIPLTLPLNILGRDNTSPDGFQVDADDLLTQPISPPKYLNEASVAHEKSWSSRDVYDLQTQPLAESSLLLKRPFVKLYDIKNCTRSLEDLYNMPTQPLIQDDKGNVYDLATQILPRQTSWGESEVSQFNPQINSTVRQSFMQPQVNSTTRSQFDVSPSTSNKENHTTEPNGNSRIDQREFSNSQEELSLSATLPIKNTLTNSTGKQKTIEERTETLKEGMSTSTFKAPLKKSENAVTPRPVKEKSRQRHEFQEFLTPEHPLLDLPKADSIRSASDRMRTLAGASKPTYHFNDSSSSDEDSVNDKKLFKKTNVSAALEKELEKVRKKEKLTKSTKEEPVEKLNIQKSKREDGKSSTTATNLTEMRFLEKGLKRGRGRPSIGEKLVPEKKSKSNKEIEDVQVKVVKKLSNTSKPNEQEQRNARSKRAGTDKKKSELISSSDCIAMLDDLDPVSTRSRGPKRKEQLSTEQNKKNTVLMSREAPAARTRVSKRVKSSHDVLEEKPMPEVRERPQRNTVTKKVDGESSSSKREKLRLTSGLTGGLSDASLTGSAGSDSSTNTTRSSRLRIIFTRMNPEPYRKCIARAGGKIVDIPELANVLVTDRICRTHKFLCATAKGIPIVGQSYLDALQASGENRNVDAWDHILSDPETEKRYKFRLRDTLLKAQNNKLFRDYTVYVTSNTQPPPLELFLILSCAGAKASKHPTHPPKDASKIFVISDPTDSATWVKFKEKFPSIEIVSTEGFMLSILQHSIHFAKHMLM